MSAVGKLCVLCGATITEDDCDKIIDWGTYTNSTMGMRVDLELHDMGVPSSVEDPDMEAVWCWKCNQKAERRTRKRFKIAEYVIEGGSYGGPDWEVREVIYSSDDGYISTKGVYGGPGFRLRQCRAWFKCKYPEDRFIVKFRRGAEWDVDVYEKVKRYG